MLGCLDAASQRQCRVGSQIKQKKMKTKTEEIEEALNFLLESRDKITIEIDPVKVSIIKQSNWGAIGYSVGVMKEGRYNYEYQFTNSLSEVAKKIESGYF
jgi:hypothetical protein